MATFGEFLRGERNKKGLNQSEFGQPFGIIMTEISKIETGKKKFPFASLEALAEFLGIDYNAIKDLYFADKFAKEAFQYNCSENVFVVAETQTKYFREINTKQGELKF